MTSLALPDRIYSSYEGRYQLASEKQLILFTEVVQKNLLKILDWGQNLPLPGPLKLHILIKAWFTRLQRMVLLEKEINCCSI